MRQFFYTTRNASLFYYQDNNWWHSGGYAFISRLTWGYYPHDRNVCQYCGHEYTGDECPGCSARRTQNIVLTGKAHITITGAAMPENAWIMSLPRILRLNYCKCGRPDVFDNWDWAINFSDCITTTKAVINPSHSSEELLCEFMAEVDTDVSIEYRGES